MSQEQVLSTLNPETCLEYVEVDADDGKLAKY
jgi:hypothetical protein